MTKELGSKVGVLQLLGVSTAIYDLLRQELCPTINLREVSDKEVLYSRFEEGSQSADTLVFGMEIEEPVRIAQRIFTYDKNLPIFILSSPSRCVQLKRTLMFSPLVGNEVTPWSTDEMDALSGAIRSAVERRQMLSMLV